MWPTMLLAHPATLARFWAGQRAIALSLGRRRRALASPPTASSALSMSERQRVVDARSGGDRPAPDAIPEQGSDPAAVPAQHDPPDLADEVVGATSQLRAAGAPTVKGDARHR